jgi:hypothetical protein
LEFEHARQNAVRKATGFFELPIAMHPEFEAEWDGDGAAVMIK